MEALDGSHISVEPFISYCKGGDILMLAPRPGDFEAMTTIRPAWVACAGGGEGTVKDEEQTRENVRNSSKCGPWRDRCASYIDCQSRHKQHAGVSDSLASDRDRAGRHGPWDSMTKNCPNCQSVARMW